LISFIVKQRQRIVSKLETKIVYGEEERITMEIWVWLKKSNGGFWVFMEKKIRKKRNRFVA